MEARIVRIHRCWAMGSEFRLRYREALDRRLVFVLDYIIVKLLGV